MTNGQGFNIDPAWKGVVKWGGLALFVAGAIAIILFILFLILGQTIPVPANEPLEAPLVPTALFLLAVFGEALLLPGGLALYFSLKDVEKTAMLFATGLWLLCVPMFLASRGLIIALSQLSARYLATTNESMKAGYLTTAEFAIESQSMLSYLALIPLAVATIMIGMVMRKGVFGKGIANLVMIAGIWTFFTPLGVIIKLPIVIPVIGVILGGVWQLIVGFKLYKIGKNT